MPHVLFLDAKWDLVTNYLCSFRAHFVITPQNLSRHTAVHATGPDVVQPLVDGYLGHTKVDYISGAGHGEYDRFKGFHDFVVWDTANTLPRLNGVIVHLFSCQTARELGRSMLEAGARAFWGYQENFRFRRKKSPPSDLYTDPTAALAIMMDCLIDIGMLQGKPPDHIYQNVSTYVTQTTSNLGPFDFNRAILNHNFRHLVCPAVHWGDRAATL